jgi:hypothetical protein
MMFVFAFLVLSLADLESLVHGGPRVVPVGWSAAWAALVALVMGGLGCEPNLRRDFGSYDQYAEYNRAVRTGSLPADIEPEVSGRRLRAGRRENLGKPFLACLLVALGVASLLTDRSVYHWVSASLFQVLAIWLLLTWWTRQQRIASLGADVERRAIRQTWG